MTLRRSKIRRASKRPLAKIQRELWELCKQIIRKKYGNECYTCGAKNLKGRDWQTGHLISKATLGANLKYDLRVLRPQCSRCNIWNGGMGAEFLRKMLIREGQEYVDSIFRDKQLKPIKAKDHYENLLVSYKLTLEDIG